MAEVLPSDELVEEPSNYGSVGPGTRLGRYELLVPVARGGMARVWAARLQGQRGFQKIVAIKTILPHLAEESEFERMFLDEARIASGVHHPNVCEIYELGEDKQALYLAMEWVSGDSLSRVLRASGKTEPFDPRVVARVVADACAGVHAAHELTDDDGRSMGVVHRDLSPHNILLTADGVAKVADFGVAKALGQLHEATSAGQLKGKIAYMAPEQITGSAIDRRSDVFSLGCVLYEATTGQRPFRGEGDHQVMHAVLKGEIEPPTSMIRGYPQELERIVLRALAPQPILRFPTAERMRFALEEFLTRGQLVTQSNVAQIVRARIGESIERRKERIRQASSAGDREGGWTEPPGGLTPSNQAVGHRSGVKPSGAHAASAASAAAAAAHAAAAAEALSAPNASLGAPPAPVPHGGRALFTTMQMGRPPEVGELSGVPMPPSHAHPMGPQAGQPTSSTTIPQAPPFAGGGHHTPVSHPGASYPGAAYTPASHPGVSFHGSAQVAHLGPPPTVVENPLFKTAVMPSVPPFPGEGAPGMTPPPPNAAATPPFPMPQDPMVPTRPQPFAPMGAPENVLAEPRGSTPPAAGQYAIAIGVGVLLAVVIGVGGFYAYSRSRAPRAPSEPALVGGGAASAVASSSPSAPTSASSPASAEILLAVSPAEAVLVVDGVELASGVRTVPRPPAGKTVTVTARAKGFEDVTVLVDFFTASPKELVLKAPGEPGAAAGDPGAAGAGAPGEPAANGAAPVATTTAEGARPGAAETAGVATTATGEEPAEKPKPKPKPKPAGDPSLPANPY